MPKMPYDTDKDLAPLALISGHYNILAVATGSNVKSIGDLIAGAKAKPGALKFSSSGNSRMTAAVTLDPAAGHGVSMLVPDGAGLRREGPASR